MNKLFENQIELISEAIIKNDLERVKFYHTVRRFNFNQYNDTGDTPLLIATRYKRMQILKYICKIPGILKEDKSFQGDTALMIATFNNDLEAIQYLVDEQKMDINCRDNKGYTPFICAAANGFVDLMIYFIFIAKADCTLRSYDKQNAAHRAAFFGNIRVLALLDSHTKVRLNQPDKFGNLPIHYAAINNHFSVVK